MPAMLEGTDDTYVGPPAHRRERPAAAACVLGRRRPAAQGRGAERRPDRRAAAAGVGRQQGHPRARRGRPVQRDRMHRAAIPGRSWTRCGDPGRDRVLGSCRRPAVRVRSEPAWTTGPRSCAAFRTPSATVSITIPSMEATGPSRITSEAGQQVLPAIGGRLYSDSGGRGTGLLAWQRSGSAIEAGVATFYGGVVVADLATGRIVLRSVGQAPRVDTDTAVWTLSYGGRTDDVATRVRSREASSATLRRRHEPRRVRGAHRHGRHEARRARRLYVEDRPLRPRPSRVPRLDARGLLRPAPVSRGTWSSGCERRRAHRPSGYVDVERSPPQRRRSRRWTWRRAR